MTAGGERTLIVIDRSVDQPVCWRRRTVLRFRNRIAGRAIKTITRGIV